MSVVFSDPRSGNTNLTYLVTDSNGNYTYTNPDATLKEIQQAFTVLLLDINSFNKATSSEDMDKYSLNILNDLQGIVTTINPCANSNLPNKCSSPQCIYVAEVQLLYISLLVILNEITNVTLKKSYDFLAFYATNYISAPITSNQINLISNSSTKYSLCNTSAFNGSWQPPSDDPKRAAAFAAVTARANSKLQTVQNNNQLHNLMYIAIALVLIIIFIVIVKNTFFNGSKTSSEVIKKIGGMLRPGPPSYVRLV